MDPSAVPQAHARTAARDPRTPGDQFATALRRLRWPVVAAWILAIVLLYGLSSSLSKVTNNGASAFLPASAASTKVVLLQQAAAHTAGQPETNAAIVVFASDHGSLTPADGAVIASARAAVARLAGRVTGLAAPGALQPSADGKAVASTVDITGRRGVWDSAAACIRNYLILRDKVRAFRADPEVKAALAAARVGELAEPTLGSQETSRDVVGVTPDVEALAARGMAFERLDQLALEDLFGSGNSGINR